MSYEDMFKWFLKSRTTILPGTAKTRAKVAGDLAFSGGTGSEKRELEAASGRPPTERRLIY